VFGIEGEGFGVCTMICIQALYSVTPNSALLLRRFNFIKKVVSMLSALYMSANELISQKYYHVVTADR